MTPEEREKLDAFVKGMMTDLAPTSAHEIFLANSMAEEAWRLNQIGPAAPTSPPSAISMAPETNTAPWKARITRTRPLGSSPP